MDEPEALATGSTYECDVTVKLSPSPTLRVRSVVPIMERNSRTGRGFCASSAKQTQLANAARVSF